MVDLELLEEIKKLAIIAMFSDDKLLERIALKGGNAIDLFYDKSVRASTDLDFSMRGDFEQYELDGVKTRLERLLKETFGNAGFIVFDINFSEKPGMLSGDLKKFWGGYKIEFKVKKADSHDPEPSIELLRRTAIPVDSRQRRKFGIDISKFEYFEDEEFELEGFVVRVYTREMLIFEKIRAICQQIPEYGSIVRVKHPSARARDFFDIYHLLERSRIDLNSPENKALLRKVFDAKRVPLELLKIIRDYREFHREDFSSLEDTVNLVLN